MFVCMYTCIYIPYDMNIWRQFNLANQSFLSDRWILHWQMLLYFTGIEENLAVFNLADFCNSPNR